MSERTDSATTAAADAPLDRDELVALLGRVFAPKRGEDRVGVLVDLPDARLPDSAAWADRRDLAAEWTRALHGAPLPGGATLRASLYAYTNAGKNNADLPVLLFELPPAGEMPRDASALAETTARARDEVFAGTPMLLMLTELSATAPLKMLAPELGFSAATMAGFSRAMQPALRLDYVEIDRRVTRLAELLGESSAATIDFVVDGAREHRLVLDLRYRRGHASGGLLRERGKAANLPSGEAYIVPYEGERGGDPSGSAGELPVELDGEVVLYRVEGNRAVAVEGDGPVAQRERAAIEAEPAYANIAELGLGVLDSFGVQPVGVTLLDEKLGPHIAFGRSDHFGGVVGPRAFSTPEAVVHIDRVYIEATQPRVALTRIVLARDAGDLELYRDGAYVVEL